jgi:hypothetical protein
MARGSPARRKLAMQLTHNPFGLVRFRIWVNPFSRMPRKRVDCTVNIPRPKNHQAASLRRHSHPTARLHAALSCLHQHCCVSTIGSALCRFSVVPGEEQPHRRKARHLLSSVSIPRVPTTQIEDDATRWLRPDQQQISSHLSWHQHAELPSKVGALTGAMVTLRCHSTMEAQRHNTQMRFAIPAPAPENTW